MPVMQVPYTRYTFTPPDIIKEDFYWHLKRNGCNFKISNFNFWKEVKVSIYIILTSVITFSICCIYPNYSISEFFGAISIVVFIVGSSSLLFSFRSYSNMYLTRRRYYNYIKRIVNETNDYNSFCRALSLIDSKYDALLNQN